MCLWASHNKANAALSGNPLPSPTNSLYLSLSLCSARSSPLAPFKLIYALLAFCLLALNSIWRVFFSFVLFSAPHITQCLRSPRIVSRLRGFRYVTLHWNVKLLDPSPPLHSTSLPFPSFLTCPLFVNSCRRVWLIVVFVCPFWLLFNCAEAVSEGGGESVDEDEELSPIATPPHSACPTCSTYPQLLTEREIYSSIGLFTVCTAYSATHVECAQWSSSRFSFFIGTVFF